MYGTSVSYVRKKIVRFRLTMKRQTKGHRRGWVGRITKNDDRKNILKPI